VKHGNTKDPDKIAAKEDEARDKQLEKLALDPLTGRVVCCAFVSTSGEESTLMITTVDNDGERTLIQEIFGFLGSDEMRIVTWNGIGFDIPFIYRRAIILNVDPANFGAPPLTAWTKRYNTDRHYDLMKIWDNWQSGTFTKLDLVAKLVLDSGEGKEEMDVTKIEEMLETDEGRAKVASYCLQDTRITMQLFKRFLGYLFA